MTTKTLKKKILPILKRQDVTRAAIFGSFARGDFHKKSDLDLLVAFRNTKSLLELAGLQIELEKRLGRKVDLLTYNSLHSLLKGRILQEQKIIYEKRS